jgi:hypothetical protein
MPNLDLTIEHTDYKTTRASRLKSRDLFVGTDAVKDKKTTYLFQGKNELDADYDVRLNRAVLDPWVERIITARQALLFAKPITRTLPTKIEEFAEDIDLHQTAAGQFFELVSRDAQVDGIHWVLVDMPPVPVGEDNEPIQFVSKKEEDEAGMRPFMQRIPGDNVIDWGVDRDGKLQWIVISQQSDDKRESFGQSPKTVAQWKVWTPQSWYLFERRTAETTGADQSKFIEVATGPNPVGEVPLVPFFGAKLNDYAGWPVARAVLDHIVLLYNKESDKDHFEMLAAHPIPVTVCPKKPEKLNTNKGLWIDSSNADGASISVTYLEPSGAAFSSAQESINAIKAKIYQLALATTAKETAQVQSADSQREDRRIFSSSLKAVSENNEAAERRCWELMVKWEGSEKEAKIEVEYSRDFDDQIVETAMLSALNGLADSNRLTTKTLLRIMKEGGVLPSSIDVDEELKELKAQEQQAVMDAVKAMQEQQHAQQNDPDDDSKQLKQ